MNREELYGIAQRALLEEELSAGEIPNIDLYVDQIISLVSDKNAESAERYRDKQLTKTMINNYSKDGLITPVKGKKYNKEQIIQILSIYTLKNTLSMGEIKRLLDGAYSIDGYDGATLIEAYDKHILIKKNNRDLALEIFGSLLDQNQLNVDDDKDFMLIVGALVSLSSGLKNIAQELIDEKYPEAAADTEKSKKEKKSKKQEETDKE